MVKPSPSRAIAVAVAAALVLAAGGVAGAHHAAANKRLTIGVNQVGEIYDPTVVLPSTVSVVASNVFDWLWWRNTSGKLQKNLVTSWKMAPDGKTLSLTLRPNVRFSNGDRLMADDVVFSWNRLKEHGFSARIARTLTSWDVVDSRHLVAHFAQPEIGFIPSLGFPIESKAYFTRVGETQFKTNPVGTGPYKIAKIAGNRYVDIVRNPRYWGKKPSIAAARFETITDDTTRLAKLKTGALDMIMQVPFQSVSSVNRSKTLKTVKLVPSGSSVYVAFKATPGQASTPWSQKQVRQAVAFAIDRKAIVKKLLKGIPVSYPFLAPRDRGYDRSIRSYAYNPQKAKQLLAAAGYPNGFSTDLPYLNAQTGMTETANAVALYLARVGIRVTPKPLNGQDFVNWVFAAAHNPRQDYIAIFLGAIAGKAEPATALLNSFGAVTPFAWYHNNEANGLILQANATVNDMQRAALIKKIQHVIYVDYGFVKLWDSASVYGMKRCISFKPQLGDFDLLLLKNVNAGACKS